MTRTQVLGVLLALALLPGTASAARPVKYAGKTKEGTRISFVLDHGWLDRFSALVPTTCVSAQGGTPRVLIVLWSPPYKYRLGRTAAVTTTNPTRHYKITSRRRGRAISGKLSMNFSLIEGAPFGGYRLLECLGTASFSLKPRHR